MRMARQRAQGGRQKKTATAPAQDVSRSKLSEGSQKAAYRRKREGTLTAGIQMRARKTRRTARRVRGKKVRY